jgi:hypothetical protein
MRSQDSYAAANISATTASFTILGGCYGADYSATWGGGSVQLNRLAGDGVTWIAAAAAWTANGTVLLLLPPGTYQLAVTTATAVYVQLVRIPGE